MNLKKIDKSLIYILLYLFSLFFYKPITTHPFFTPHNLEIAFDSYIPFISKFIVVYNSYFFFLMSFGIYLYIKDKNLSNIFFSSLIFAQIIAYIIFIFYPTDISSVRPIITDTDIFSRLVKRTYAIDTIYDGLPSLHTSSMTILILSVIYSKINKYYKPILIIYSILIIATTVLVKQHVFVDIPAGIILGILSFYLSKYLIFRKNTKYDAKTS